MLTASIDDKSEAFKLGSSWIIDGGLAGPNNGGKIQPDGAQTVSIRSLEFPDYYIRIINGFTVVL